MVVSKTSSGLLPPPLGEGWGRGKRRTIAGSVRAPIPAFPKKGNEQGKASWT